MPEDRSKSLREELRRWIATEVPEARSDDLILDRYIDGCKGDIETAKLKMRNYYEMRRSSPEWFANRDPRRKEHSDLIDLGAMLPLAPSDDSARPAIILVRATVNNPKKNPMQDVFKVGIMTIDLAMEQIPAITRNGIYLIIDLRGVGLGHALQMTPNLVRRAVHSWQDCYPIRILRIDFVNCPLHVNIVLNLFIRFMKEKLRKRITTHRDADLSALGHVLDPRSLPDEFGGTLGPLDALIAQSKRNIYSHREWFIKSSTSPE